MKHKALIHAALLGLQDELGQRGGVPPYGICIYLDCHFGGDNYGEVGDEVSDLMKRWPKFSGADAYPVPAPSNYKLPEGARPISLARAYFWECGSKEARWDASTEYGAARRELLAWLIEQTKG